MAMWKAIAGVTGLAAAVVLVAANQGRRESEALQRVAPRAGTSYGALMALGERIGDRAGIGLSDARDVVYLVACSGLFIGEANIAPAAGAAAALVASRNLKPRDAVAHVLSIKGQQAANQALQGCD